jgi:hypothetical protein
MRDRILLEVLGDFKIMLFEVQEFRKFCWMEAMRLSSSS